MGKSHKKAGNLNQRIDNRGNSEKLHFWQDKYAEALNQHRNTLSKIDNYFNIYEGSGDIRNKDGAVTGKTDSVRKVVFELIESQTDLVVPMPKVTSLSGNENRAMTIEHYIMNEIDRLDFDKIADMQARTTPIAGASFFHVEWDNSVNTRNTVGKLKVSDLDPRCVIPQPGIVAINDMDYIFLRLEETKLDIKNRYDIEIPKLRDISQSDPDMDETNNDDLVTHIYCYYKDNHNNICLFSWVDDIVINDLENYFARKEYRCSKCNEPKIADQDKCPKCGSKKFELKDVTNEKITLHQNKIDPLTGQTLAEDIEIEVPYYTPKTFPIVKRVNVSKRNSFIGSSDVDAIKDQQNDLNISMDKIKQKLLKGGSIVTIPEDCDFKATDEELKIVKLKDPSQKALFDAVAIQPNISTDLGFLELNYNVARQTIGITNSYQGREDSTATSGKAKQISAENAAGRFESKKTMKNDAYADLYKVMFQFMLAYADEPRSIYYQDEYGQMQYKMFDKRMFIDRDDAGDYFYDDEFVFDTDESSTLANNRQLMWAETRNNFISGAYGDAADANTLVMYWQMMDTLHYPGAKQALKFASDRLQRQQEAQERQLQMQQDQQNMQIQSATENSRAKLIKSQSDAAKTQAEINNGNRSVASKY